MTIPQPQSLEQEENQPTSPHIHVSQLGVYRICVSFITASRHQFNSGQLSPRPGRVCALASLPKASRTLSPAMISYCRGLNTCQYHGPTSLMPSAPIVLYTCAYRIWEDYRRKIIRGGHIVLESIMLRLRYKAGPQGVFVNPQGGARLAIDRR